MGCARSLDTLLWSRSAVYPALGVPSTVGQQGAACQRLGRVGRDFPSGAHVSNARPTSPQRSVRALLVRLFSIAQLPSVRALTARFTPPDAALNSCAPLRYSYHAERRLRRCRAASAVHPRPSQPIPACVTGTRRVRSGALVLAVVPRRVRRRRLDERDLGSCARRPASGPDRERTDRIAETHRAGQDGARCAVRVQADDPDYDPL